MGFFDKVKSMQAGAKAYRMHVTGMQLRKQGKYAESEEKLNEAITLYGEAYAAGFRKTNAMQGYALLLMRSGDFARARDIMLECSKNKEMSKEDRFALRVDFSICQWKMGNLDKAIETVQMAAEQKKSSLVYTTLGMYLIEKARRTGDFEEAIRFNQEAYEYDDEDSGVLDNMGQLNMALAERTMQDGDKAQADELYEKAFEHLKKAYEVKPEQVSSAYYYAKILHHRGEDAKAREVIEEVRKIPLSAILQIDATDLENLAKEIG